MHAFITAAQTVFGPWVTLIVVCLVLILCCGVVMKGFEYLWRFLMLRRPRTRV